LIGILVDLQAVETIDIIEQAFIADAVDTFIDSTRQTKSSKGFGSTPSNTKKKKSRKSSGKRKK
jgi:hypothetical protein